MKTLVIGAAIVDIIMKIPRLPKKGEDIFCNERTLSIGGCAYNVANILYNFDIDHDLFVPVGDGVYADIIKKNLKAKNYKVLVDDSEMDNGYSLCLVEDDGERTFINVKGIEGKYKKKWFDDLNMEEYQNIYVAGYQVCGKSGKIISHWLTEQENKNIFFAPGPVITEIEESVMKRIFSTRSILHLNKKEALDFTGKDSVEDSILALYELNKNNVFITMGGDGTLFYDGNKITQMKGEKVKVVDTIGAGDSHIGAIISAYSMGYDFNYACILANKVAGKIVQVQGTKIDKESFDKLQFLV